jgi:hypothetical protein
MKFRQHVRKISSGTIIASSNRPADLPPPPAAPLVPLPQNKVGKPVLSFNRRKVSFFCPRLPHIPPQIHQKNTTSAHHFSQNTPQKRPKTAKNIPATTPNFFCNK